MPLIIVIVLILFMYPLMAIGNTLINVFDHMGLKASAGIFRVLFNGALVIFVLYLMVQLLS